MPLEAYSPGTVTVELGSDPSATLVVELGTPGPQGQQGEPGQNGQNGVGVPAGGTAGQVLAKIDETDYNTEWVDAGGGSNPADGFTLNEYAVINATSAGNTINIGDQTTQVGTALNLYNSNFVSYNNINNLTNNIYYLDNLAITGNIGIIDGLTINAYNIVLGSGMLNFGQSQINFTNSAYITTTDNGLIISGSSNGKSYISAFNGTEGTGFYFSTNGEILTYGGFNDGINDYGLLSTALIKSNVGFQFGDGSIQTTAAFSGDRYKTTSTSSNTINNGNGKSFICDTGLSYTTLQTCIIYEPSNPQGLHMHCNVVSYDTSTGELIVDVTSHTGSGTHTDWVINK